MEADRIRELDREIHAFSHIESLPATGEGPLTGLTFGVKEMFDVGGLPTQYGSPIFRGRVPSSDCALVAQLRALGAIVAGMTHMTAFAYFDASPTRNPRNLAHTPGGSSSGSAAAVAAGMVDFAIGSQTQGSVLRPASFCGVVGFKPTHGVLPLTGVLAFAPELDTAGLFTAKVDEMRSLWESLDHDIVPPGPVSFSAFPPQEDIHPAMKAAFLATVARLGAKLVEPPASFHRLPSAVTTLQDHDGAVSLREIYREHGPKVGAKLSAMIERGMAIDDSQRADAWALIQLARQEMEQVFAGHTVLLTPAAVGPAPEGYGYTGDPRMNAPFTGLGTPAISVPMPVAAGQLPLGVQLAAARGAEALLLKAACIVEECD